MLKTSAMGMSWWTLINIAFEDTDVVRRIHY